ncbi:MAG: pimeloyl-ACP methyl ester carboxylesterase [Spirosomataceae bacterium]|jgi:pimeloyl-ACP methyl ester carboxylesterase
MTNRLSKSGIIYITALLTLFWSCNTIDPIPEENTYLVSTELINSYTAKQYKELIDGSLGSQIGGLSISSFIQSGIDQIRVVYNTQDLEGNDILASGALILPNSLPESTFALGSVQHGTIFDEADAPSYFGVNLEASLGGVLASTGMIIVLPDYLGYGASKNIAHPYEHKEGSAEPNIDFLRAVKEYIEQENIKFNGKLLLAGYSQGGYTTMAMHKAIQEENDDEFNVVVSSLGAGAYNKTASVLDIVSRDSNGDPAHNSSYIWVLQTYNNLEGLNRSVSDYFIEPFASQIEQSGERTRVTQSFRSILQPDFITGIINKTDTEFLEAVAKNDVFDWKPTAPVSLYHGTADQYVPFLNSQTTFDAMKKRNAPNITLIPVEGGTHSSTLTAYFLGTFQLFSSYR